MRLLLGGLPLGVIRGRGLGLLQEAASVVKGSCDPTASELTAAWISFLEVGAERGMRTFRKLINVRDSCLPHQRSRGPLILLGLNNNLWVNLNH